MTVIARDSRGIVDPARGERHFTLARYRPSPQLEPVVERHWVVRWDLRGRAPFTQEVVPHPCVNLATEPGGRVAVHGIGTGRFARTIAGHGVVVGTKFRPGAFAHFSALPGWRLTDATLPLAEAFARGGAALERELRGLGDPRDPNDPDAVSQRIELVESALGALLPDRLDPEAVLVTEIATWMLTAPPTSRIPDIAAQFGLSTRSLQRLFRGHVGVSPKWVLKRYRIHQVAELAAAGEDSDWAMIAADFGFADQAHLIRDFRAAVGRSPAEYARACAAA